MERILFNAGWSVRRKANRYAEMSGTAEAFTPVAIPHDAMLTNPRDQSAGAATGFFPGGSWEYTKSFAVGPELGGQRLFVHFEGVYRDALVTVNGGRAGHRPYGYSGFTVRIDELVHVGNDNVIHVDVTAGDDGRSYTGAGLYRSVHLLAGPPVRIAADGLRVTTLDIDESHALIEVCTTVDNDSSDEACRTVETEIVGPDGRICAADRTVVTAWPGRAQRVRQRILLGDAALWSVDSPSMYSCRVSLADGNEESDRSSTTFGVRTLQVDAGRGLRINGQPVKLRGACVHHDNGVLGAATFPRADERRVELLKAAGFNALRSAHNPMSEAMLDACDRVGMLVMDEAFDAWTEPKATYDYARSFEKWWPDDLAAMVAKDYNHPSVVMYSIGNEIAEVGRPDGARRSREMAEFLREQDPTRFVTNGINALHAVGNAVFADVETPPRPEMGINSLMTMMQDYLPMVLRSPIVDQRLQEAYATLDIVGYNYLETCYELDHQRHPHRVIVGSETMPPLIGRHWPTVRDNAHVIGDFTWAGWDYLGEAGIGRIDREGAPVDGFGVAGRYPHIHGGTGDLDLTGFRKPVSYLREIVYGLRTEPFIAVQDPAHHGVPVVHHSPWTLTDAVASWGWPGHEGKPVTVEVYADGDEVELLVNGESVGRRPAGPEAEYCARFDTTYRPGVVKAVAYRSGKEIGRTAITSPNADVAICVQSDRTEIRGDGTDLAFITIELVDAQGVLHVTGDRLVSISIDGPAVLAGFGSAAQSTEESYLDATHTTFQGRALAVIRPTGPGLVSVNITADQIDPVGLTLHAS